MATTKDHPVLRFLRRIKASDGPVNGSDGQLLARFVSHRDEAAFAELLQRHGPMVFGVCARILGASPDAEDAFQAVFLVLARRASSLREPASLGSWLYGVAYRTALKTRAEAAIRRTRESRVSIGTTADPVDDAARLELRRVIDAELNRLPDKYRTAVVLCYLEGQTQEEAARQLGCPRKTVTTRLARACERLRGPLTRRGLAFSAAGLAVLLVEEASAAAPAALTNATIKAAILFAAGNTVTGVVSAHGLTLTRKVLKTMFLMKLTQTAGLLLAAVIFCAAVGVVAFPALATNQPQQNTPAAAKPAEEPKEDAALKELQGEWKAVGLVTEGKTATENDVKGMSWTIKGSTLQVFNPDGKSRKAEIKVDGSKDPKHIDIIIPEGDLKGQSMPGIYKLENGRLTVCLRDEKHLALGHPKEFTAAKGSNQGIITLENVDKPPEKPADATKLPKEDAALKELQGDWSVVELTDGGRTTSGDDVKGKHWTFKGAQLEAAYPGQLSQKAEIKVDKTKDPKQIDVKVVEGDLKGTTLPGIYRLEKSRLIVCLRDNDKLAMGRPTEFTAVKGTGQGMITLEKATKEPEKRADAIKELQGEWQVVGLVDEGKDMPAEIIKEMRWLIKDAELLPVETSKKLLAKATITLDASKEPKQIDIAIHEGNRKGQTLQGIYKLENGKWIACLRAAELAEKGRPTEFKSEKNSGIGLISLELVKLEGKK